MINKLFKTLVEVRAAGDESENNYSSDLLINAALERLSKCFMISMQEYLGVHGPNPNELRDTPVEIKDIEEIINKFCKWYDIVLECVQGTLKNPQEIFKVTAQHKTQEEVMEAHVKSNSSGVVH